jgi:hypothetical protein
MCASSSRSYSRSVAVSLPSNGDIRAGIGEDCNTTLNVIKMFAGTEEFCPVLIGMLRAICGALRTYTGG